VDLSLASCWTRLGASEHAVLSTVHPVRGVDAVPVVFVVVGGRIGVPVDTVKPKRHTSLQRLANVAEDPRCVLLVEHYERNWSHLWWVRLHAEAAPTNRVDVWLQALADKYPAYRGAGTVEDVLVLSPIELTGWSAAD
jgi:hypothetical protein